MSDPPAGENALSDDEYDMDDQVVEEPLMELDPSRLGEPTEDIESELEGDFAFVSLFHESGTMVLIYNQGETMRRERKDKVEIVHGTSTFSKSLGMASERLLVVALTNLANGSATSHNICGDLIHPN